MRAFTNIKTYLGKYEVSYYESMFPPTPTCQLFTRIEMMEMNKLDSSKTDCRYGGSISVMPFF